ncbi:2-amino-5-chloromuconate deaminase CnbZ, partial [Singulisphaera rosea]
MPTVKHPTGDYAFLPGIAPYSCGVVSVPGYEIAHVTLHTPVPYHKGFDRIVEHLESEGRPKAALCGVELRSPRPFTFDGFAAFNAEYAQILDAWGVFVDGVNPVARTNVAPEGCAPKEPVLYGFS